MPVVEHDDGIYEIECEDYFSFTIDPEYVIEYYAIDPDEKVAELAKLFGDNFYALREYVENTSKRWFYLDNYYFDVIPDGYAILIWYEGSNGKLYVAIQYPNSTVKIYRIHDHYELEDIIMSLTTIFVRCVDTNEVYEIRNSSYDYYEIVLEDGSVLTSGINNKEYEEVLNKILNCSKIYAYIPKL